ncbi:ATP-binding cassette domain-containing protein, partial [Shewanella sp. 0m-11]
RTPVKALSGGEKNRLLLARLLLRPANLIILDEPTNDLDIETLELLESLLADYKGTLLLVSHDRAFIDNTVTSSWWFTGNGGWSEYVGGYEDAVSQGARFYSEEPQGINAVKAPVVEVKPVVQSVAKKVEKKLSYQLQRELESLPALMEQLEQELENLQAIVSSPEFYAQEQKIVNENLKALSDKESQLESCFERWEELESLK